MREGVNDYTAHSLVVGVQGEYIHIFYIGSLGLSC